MNLKDVKDGDIYWHITPSNETINFDPHSPPIKPKQGKARFNGYGVLELFDFDSETGEIDYDSNARHLIDKSDQLFLTEESAKIAYKESISLYVMYRVRELNNLIEEFGACYKFQYI